MELDNTIAIIGIASPFCISFVVLIVKLVNETKSNTKDILEMKEEHKSLSTTVDEISEKLTEHFSKTKNIEHDLKGIRGQLGEFYKTLERLETKREGDREDTVQIKTQLSMILQALQNDNKNPGTLNG